MSFQAAEKRINVYILLLLGSLHYILSPAYGYSQVPLVRESSSLTYSHSSDVRHLPRLFDTLLRVEAECMHTRSVIIAQPGR